MHTALGQDDDALIRRCVSYVYRGLSPSLTRDDLLQEGRIAIWLADRDGRIPSDPLHRRRYIRRRAIGAMVDANRQAWRQQPIDVCELGDEHHAESADRPDLSLQLRQLLEHLTHTATERTLECIELLAEGRSAVEVAGVMGVDPSRVSQLRREAKRLVAELW
jgi:RNA polymerase sigma factor (sigma-70 family)